MDQNLENKEITPQLPEKLNKRAKMRYLQLIKHPGKDLPKFSEIPEEFFLPKDIIQPTIEAFKLTQKDGHERAQRLYYKDNKIVRSKIYRGEKESMDVFSHQISGFVTEMFGEIPLVNFHTHPKINSADFSREDVANFAASPRGGYMYLTIANGGIAVLLRTQKTSKIPLSSTYKYTKVRKHLESQWNKSYGKLGYAFYTWENPDHEIITNKYGFPQKNTAPLDFSKLENGITLTKIN